MISKEFKLKKALIFKYLIISLVAVFFQILMSNQVQSIINIATTKSEDNIIFPFIIALIAIIMYQVIMVIKNKIANNIIRNSVIKLKQRLFLSFFTLEPKHKAKYISTFCNDLPLIEENYYICILNRIEMLSVVTLVSIALLNVNWFIFICILLLMLLNLLINAFSQSNITKNMTELSKLYDEDIKKLDNYFDGYITIKSLKAEMLITSIYNNVCECLETKKYKYLYKINVLSSIHEGMSFFDIIIITLISSYMITKGTMTLGNLVNITILANMFFGSVPMLLMSTLTIRSTKGIWDKINSLTSLEKNIKYNINEEFKEIQAINVNVDFDGKNIIKNFNLTIKKGDKVCIKGRNGSGKSTFVNCLCGLQQYDGIILYNKQNINKINVFNDFCYISQNPFVFTGNIDFNIFLNKEDYESELFLKLLDILELRDFYYLRREESIDIDNTTISGGEKQKIALLRSLLHKPEVLILDEALSMVDFNSRSKILKFLSIQDFTLIHITHDFETNELYNQIVDFDCM